MTKPILPNVSYGMNMYESQANGTTMFPVGLPNMAITLHNNGGFVIHDLVAQTHKWDTTHTTLSTTDSSIGLAAIVQGF